MGLCFRRRQKVKYSVIAVCIISIIYIMYQKVKYSVIAVCIISIIYIMYQVIPARQLSNKSHLKKTFVRGVHYSVARHYYADEDNKFTCLYDGEVIHIDKINDNYCDCKDGTDEPGTDACPNGKFFCEHDVYKRGAVPLESGKINDGICDCCDGSDEWNKVNLPFKFADHVQKEIGTFLSPCSYTC